MTEFFSTTFVSVSPPKMAAKNSIPKNKIMKKTNNPTIVANTFPKNLIVVFFLNKFQKVSYCYK
jgi:hypothetical protein